LRSRTPEYQEKLKEQFLKHALVHIVNGDFRANVDRVIDWTKIREGHEAMERNEIMGKIICTVDT
jgi:NADPH:quinone reductase-like Zn-dependent oxidoreductase